MNINIRPDPIIDAGNDMTELASVTEELVDGRLGANRTAAAAHPGWQSSAALTQVTQAWETHLGGLIFEVGQLGVRLRDSAHAYTQADAEAERRVREVLDLLGGA